MADHEASDLSWPRRVTSLFHRRSALSVVPEDIRDTQNPAEHHNGDIAQRLKPHMIRRMDDPPKLVNPSGWISEGRTMPSKRASTISARRSQVLDESSLQPASPNTLSSSPQDACPPELQPALDNGHLRESKDTTSYVPQPFQE